MMVTGKEPFEAERLLLSTGIVAHNMQSNWENGRYSPVGGRPETLGGVYGTGRLMGFDPPAPGPGTAAIGATLLAGLGGGAGVQLARRWRAGRRKED